MPGKFEINEINKKYRIQTLAKESNSCYNTREYDYNYICV